MAGVLGQLRDAHSEDGQLMQGGARTQSRRQPEKAVLIQAGADARQHGRANLVNHLRLEQRVTCDQRDG